MVDNVTTPIPTGINFATDDVAGIIYPRTKLSIGVDGVAVDVSATNPVPIISPYLPAGTDKSSTIAAGNVPQVLAVANPTRRGLIGQNISTGDLWINEVGGNAAIGTAGSYRLASGDTFSISTNRAISILGATTAQAFTAIEY